MELVQIVDSLKDKKILFLGQSRTMSKEDIELFLEQIGAKRAEDETDEPIALIVLGRLINPYEEAYSDEKKRAGVFVVTLEDVEKYYAYYIDPDALLGSLRLFANRERIINLLRNRAISDDLFCDILKLYDWEDKTPFETDENRDVAGMIVARFYPNIERNHNIQYSPIGPFLVASQCENIKLLEAMSLISDYEITQRSQDIWMPRTLHEAILINSNLPTPLLEKFWQTNSLRKQGFVAMHPNLPKSRQDDLINSKECWILEGLARNPNLSQNLYDKFLNSTNRVIKNAFLQNQPLNWDIIKSVIKEGDEKSLEAIGLNPHLNEEVAIGLINLGNETLISFLASNSSLSKNAYEAIELTKNVSILRRLAANPSAPSELLERLTRIRDKDIYVALAANPTTPKTLLRNFSKIKDEDIRISLASNPSTPIEILLSYQTDANLANILKRNEAFTDYIKQNIGW